MRRNPGRKARRANLFGHRQSTRMNEFQRNRQAECDRFGGIRTVLGTSAEADPMNVEAAEDDTGDISEELAYPGAHKPSGVREVTAYERAILGALQHKPTYQGSVHVDVIAARRTRNSAAPAGPAYQSGAVVMTPKYPHRPTRLMLRALLFLILAGALAAMAILEAVR